MIQSHRSPLPFQWIERCLEAVREWCSLNQYDYQFFGNALFAEDYTELSESLKKRVLGVCDRLGIKVLIKYNSLKGWREAKWQF